MKRAVIPASCSDRNASRAKGAHESFFSFRIPWLYYAQRDFLVLWRPWPPREARDQLFASAPSTLRTAGAVAWRRDEEEDEDAFDHHESISRGRRCATTAEIG